MGIDRSLGAKVVGAIGGGIGARGIPETFMSSSNTGVVGYGLNLLVTVAGWIGLKRFGFPNLAEGWLIGGAAMTVGRVASDYWGKTLVTFGTVPGLSGDPAFNFSGYDPYSFPLPTVDDDGVSQLGPAHSIAAVQTVGPKGQPMLTQAPAPTVSMPSDMTAMPSDWTGSLAA